MGDLTLRGATSGSITITPTAVAGTNTITLPAATGTVALTASPTFTGVTTESTITSPAATALTIQSAGTTAMTVSTGQNVGIGTTSPGQRLDIQQASTDYQMRIGDAGANYYDIGRNTANGLLTFNGNQAAASGYVFSTVNGERMRIDTSGNLLVGTTSSSYSQSGIIIEPAYNSAGNSGMAIQHQNGSASGSLYISFVYNALTIGAISQNGTAGVSFLTSSDYRLKDNIASMVGALDKIALLKPVTYTWKSDGSNGQGFIAHELQAVVPDAVSGEKDAVNEDGSIKPQGVDYSKIVVHLVAALQELSAKNDALEARLAALEAK